VPDHNMPSNDNDMPANYYGVRNHDLPSNDNRVSNYDMQANNF
jgi:hypothetical protein